MCGRRHFVVLMICFGLLIYIGVRAAFTIVITHIIEKSNKESQGIIPIECLNGSDKDFKNDWPKSYVMEFQMVYYVATLITQVPAGALALKFSSRRVSGIAVMLTSILTICLRFALQYPHSWLVFLIRIVQGLIEGSLVPAFNGVLAAWAPKSEKSILVVAAYSGAYLSTFVADIVSGLLLCRVDLMGSPLFVYGAVGFVWSVIWLTCLHDNPYACKNLSEREKQLFPAEDQHKTAPVLKLREMPWCKILTSMPLMAIVIASFNRNWIFALLITQLPQYFKDQFGLTPAQYGIWTGLPHVFMTCVLIPVGFVVNTLINRGIVSTTVARKTAETIGFGVEGGCFLALGILKTHQFPVAVALICAGVGMSGFAISGYQVNCLDLAPRYTSVLTGLMRLGTIGAVISQVLAMVLTEGSGNSEGWSKVFIIAGSLHLFGVAFYLIFASGEIQPWAIDQRELLGQERLYDPSIQDEVENNDIGYESEEVRSLLTKSVIERAKPLDLDGELEESGWFLSTI